MKRDLSRLDWNMRNVYGLVQMLVFESPEMTDISQGRTFRKDDCLVK